MATATIGADRTVIHSVSCPCPLCRIGLLGISCPYSLQSCTHTDMNFISLITGPGTRHQKSNSACVSWFRTLIFLFDICNGILRGRDLCLLAKLSMPAGGKSATHHRVIISKRQCAGPKSFIISVLRKNLLPSQATRPPCLKYFRSELNENSRQFSKTSESK